MPKKRNIDQYKISVQLNEKNKMAIREKKKKPIMNLKRSKKKKQKKQKAK